MDSGGSWRVGNEIRRDLNHVEKALPTIGWALLGLSIVLAGLVLPALHFLGTWGLSQGAVFQTVVLAPIWLVAVALLAVMVWAQWKTRADSENMFAYLVAIVVAVVAIGVAIQAFAAMNVYMVLRGIGGPDTTQSFWRAETFYLWHLLDAIPLVDVTSTLRWSEPLTFRDHWSGSLLLLFKIVAIGPFIGLGYACYRTLEKERRHAEASTGKGFNPIDVAERIRIGAGGAVGAFVVLLLLSIALYLASPLMFDSSSRLNRWIQAHVPASVAAKDVELPLSWIDVRDLELPLSWIEVVPQSVAVALLIYLAAIVIFLAFLVDLGQPHSAWRVVSPLGGYLCLIVVLAEIWSLLTLTLMHWGLSTAEPAIPAGNEVPTTVRYYLWHALEVVPALDVPKTLNLSLPAAFVDRTSAALLLAFQIAFLIVLAFPIARLVRTYMVSRRRI